MWANRLAEVIAQQSTAAGLDARIRYSQPCAPSRQQIGAQEVKRSVILKDKQAGGKFAARSAPNSFESAPR